MSTTQSQTMRIGVEVIASKQKQRGLAFCSDRSELWFDSDSAGEDKGAEEDEVEEGDEDGEADSTSGESSDSNSTPESSPPSNRHAMLHGQEDAADTAFGAFDAKGNWYWSKRRLQDGPRGGAPSDDGAIGRSALNRHDRTQMIMTGSVVKQDRPVRATDVFWTGDLESLRDDDEDPYDAVGHASYRSRRSSDSSDENHSIVLPVRIRLEYDSSSDESESSGTSSSSGSDSEARRQASMHMLQRLGRNIAIPPRRTSAVRLGHGAPRRPPSLDEISSRVVSGYGRGTSRARAQAYQQRAVSCPSPLPLQWFGEVQVMVTPPTPQMPSEKIPGVVLKSPHMPSCSFSTDVCGNLIAPAFDVAPGRQIMLAEREQQAKQWMEAFKKQQQQRFNLNLGAGHVAPPMANAEQAAATFTSRSPPRCRTPLNGGEEAGLQPRGAPVIPPRRRSFARRVSGQLQPASQTSVNPVPIMAAVDTAETTTHTQVDTRVAHSATAAVVPYRRSLVARLSLGKSGRKINDGQGSSLAPRTLVPAAPA